MLVADKDYHYIYDPEHKKHPGGGYVKTEKGWQKGKQQKKDKQQKNENTNNTNPLTLNKEEKQDWLMT